MLKAGIGKTGIILALLLATAMCVLSYIFKPAEIVPLQHGICLPSPDAIAIDSFGSWLVNTLLIGMIALVVFLTNRRYNFIRTTEPAFPAIFLIMAASNPLLTQSLNTSMVLCLANVVCLFIIFATYGRVNATQQLFLMGAVIGVGSMFQYAFLPMAAVYLLWALFMKVLRFKVLLAFLAGFLCPYWIALGIGWIHFSDFRFPALTSLFDIAHDHSEILLLLIGIGLAASIGFILVLVNSIKLYAGNSRVNAMNLCVTALGAAAAICILVDYENLTAYVITLYVACAIQIANICALWSPRMPWIVTAVPAGLYLALFVCGLIF